MIWLIFDRDIIYVWKLTTVESQSQCDGQATPKLLEFRQFKIK